MAQLPTARDDSQLENLQTWFRRNIAILANIEGGRPDVCTSNGYILNVV